MAGETELERMVLKLLTDVEGYIQPLKEAVDASKDAAKEVENAGKIMEQLGDKLQSYGKKLSLYVTAPLVAMAGIATAAFGVQEAEEIKLRGILEANERQVESLFKDYATYASALQQVTVNGDEATLGMLRTAEALGVTGEAAKLAIKESMGLAAAVGMNARSAIRYTAMLAQGDTMMLQRYVPTLRKIEDQEERVAEAHRVLGNMFAVATAEAETFTGQLKQLWNATGDLMEQFGAVVAKYLKPLVTFAKNAVHWFQQLTPTMKELTVVTLALVAAVGPALIGLGLFLKTMAFLHTTLVVTKVATWALVSAVTAHKAAIVAATIATMFLKAVSSPAGMALIAAGIVVATGAVMLYISRLEEATDKTKDLLSVSEDAGNKMEAVMDSAKTATDAVTGSVENLGRALKTLTPAQQGYQAIQAQHAAAVKSLEELEEKVRSVEEAVARRVPGAGGVEIAGVEVPLEIARGVLEDKQRTVDMLGKKMRAAWEALTKAPETKKATEDLSKAREELAKLDDEITRTMMEWRGATEVEKRLYDLEKSLGPLANKEFMDRARRRLEFLEDWKEEVRVKREEERREAQWRDYISPGVQGIRRGSVQEALLKQETYLAMRGGRDTTVENEQLVELKKIAASTNMLQVLAQKGEMGEFIPADLPWIEG